VPEQPPNPAPNFQSSPERKQLVASFLAKFGARPATRMGGGPEQQNQRIQAALDSGNPNGLLPLKRVPGLTRD
jgi:hypothetical protein